MTNEERDSKINQISSDVSDIKTNTAILNKLVEKHDIVLFGNGRPGIIEEVKVSKQLHEDCPARQEYQLSNKTYRNSNIIALIALIITVIVLFANAMSWLLKIKGMA